MKTRHLLLIVLLPLFGAKCVKEEKPDYPCVGQKSFYCKINGEPFIVQGQFPCPAYNQWYDPVTGNLSISGWDCRAEHGEAEAVSFYMFGMLHS
jgi:hypothetical protein